MIVVVLLTFATGTVLLWALYTEQVPPPRSTIQAPRWVGLPGPTDIQRHDFPLTVGGYDPHAVDAHLRAVSEAFTMVRARLDASEAVGGGSDAVSAQEAIGGGSDAVSAQEAIAPPPAAGGTWAPPTLPPEGRDDRPPDGHDGLLGSISDD